VLPISGHGAGTADEESPAGELGLLDLEGLSLGDLSRLDDSVVSRVIRDLVRRRRCGTEDGERFSNWNSSI
jgi:hypothetical protein